MTKTKDQKWELEFEQKVERFVIGILGQYGKPLSELSEVQIVCLKKDIKQLARGVLVEAERGQEKVIDNYLKKMSIKDLVLKIAKTKKHKFNLLGNCPHCDRPFIVKNSPIIKQKIVKKRGLGTRLGWMNAKDILELKKLGFGERKIARVTGWSFYTIRDVIANPLPYKLKK